MPNKKAPFRLLRSLIVLSAAGIIVSGIVLAADNKAYSEGNAAYKMLQQIGPGERGSEPDQGKAKESTNPGADFAELEKINPDTVGWITADGSRIDYPVVQGRDNEYYLDHMFDRRENKVGAIFMDWRNTSDFSDKNTILYGHHMKDGSMFAGLAGYKDQGTYDKFPEMMLFTPSGNYKIDLFAGNIIHGSADEVPLSFKTEEEFQHFILEVRNKSTFKVDVQVTKADRIITLATCTYEFNNARYIVFGKLIPLDQELFVPAFSDLQTTAVAQ